MAPSIWYTRWQPMQHPPVLFVSTRKFGQRFSAATTVAQHCVQYIAEKGKNTEGGEQAGLKTVTRQCLLFFDFLWDLWGDLDLERDFLVDFFGVLERDLLDRLGVRGEGDLTGQTCFSYFL